MVEFDFDLASDTATSVASEMVEEMSLSACDAARIASAIRAEILALTHKVYPLDDMGVLPHAKSEVSTRT